MITSESFQSSLLTGSPPISAPQPRESLSRSPLQFIRAWNYAADILTCACVVFAIQMLTLYGHPAPAHWIRAALVISIEVGLLSAVLLKRDDLNDRWLPPGAVRETAATVRMSGQAAIVLIPAIYLLLPRLPGDYTLLSLVLIPVTLTVQRRWFAAVILRLHESSATRSRVIVYGASEAGRRIASALASSKPRMHHPITLIDEDRRSANDCRFELVSRGISVQCAAIDTGLLKSLDCDLLILAASHVSAEKRASRLAAAAEAGSQVAQLSDFHLDPVLSREFLELGGHQLTREKVRRISTTYALGKRALDVLLSVSLLVLFAPVLLFLSLLVRLSSPGPVLFVQRRVGLNGRLFRMYKFRSMASHAKRYECSPKSSTDSRITGVGRFLRRTSLDELPQLLNVVRGDMSLVGPRPEMPFIVRRYTPQQRQRLQVLPGITGLWQLSADRAYPIHENLHHDLSYIRDRCFSLDLAILIHTVLFAMKAGV